MHTRLLAHCMHLGIHVCVTYVMQTTCIRYMCVRTTRAHVYLGTHLTCASVLAHAHDMHNTHVITHTHTRVCARTRIYHACIHHTHVHARTHTCTCTHIIQFMCTHTHKYTRMHVHMHTCLTRAHHTHVRTCMITCIRTHMHHIHAYLCAHKRVLYDFRTRVHVHTYA